MTETQTSRENRDRAPSRSASDDDLLALDTPVVSFHVHRPHMPGMPRMAPDRRQEMDRAMETARTFLPPWDRLAYYSALGLMAVVGLMEWPVAAAIGAGTMIAQRGRGAMEPTGRPSEPSARTTTETPSRARPTRARTSRTTTSRTASRSTASRAASPRSRTA